MNKKRTQLVFATHNRNKLKEVQTLLPSPMLLLSLDDIGCHEEIIEDALTIEGNALIKANYVLKHYGLPCFADDTGLEVNALHGEPGVYSARYAGLQRKAEDNNHLLLENLAPHQDRSARFKTVIALARRDEEPLFFEGICPGLITKTPRGADGFGYDPIFQPDGYQQTFAQMPLELKNKIGHRGRAMKKLLAFLDQEKI
ncbi:RdgB/HAM1 family non-canonical purine NTP pyrophosphatase [Croceiramulus getboli]|nr:RdgB/HAM1 family non-canonical purine NTP pyrophosphatase [Flavobacteriaceae bacterium YJPT1-3]